MGGGNAMKSATAKKRNADKKGAGNKGSQKKTNEAAKSIVCSICRQQFMCNARRPQLEEHMNAKHSGKATYETCFPNVEA